MRKVILSVVAGTACAILTANLLHSHYGLNAWAVIIGLIAGLEVGYWSYDSKLATKIHQEFLLFPFRRVPLGFYLFVVAFGSMFLAVYFSSSVYEWFGGVVGANLHPSWNESGAENVPYVFAWMYKDGNILGMLFGLAALVGSVGLSIFVSQEMFEQETNPVLRGMAFVCISIGSVAIGLATTFLVIAAAWLIAIGIAIIAAVVVICAIGSTFKLASMNQLAAITVGIIAGTLGGLTYNGWTNMVFQPTLIACGIGSVIGCASAYVVHRIGLTEAFQQVWERTTR